MLQFVEFEGWTPQSNEDTQQAVEYKGRSSREVWDGILTVDVAHKEGITIYFIAILPPLLFLD